MKTMFCWRCQMDIPMLDEAEYEEIMALHSLGMRDLKQSETERFRPVLRKYEELTGFKETNPWALFHHRISLYGPDCKKCQRPLRSVDATFCAECGQSV
jgi:hypothetical protein